MQLIYIYMSVQKYCCADWDRQTFTLNE